MSADVTQPHDEARDEACARRLLMAARAAITRARAVLDEICHILKSHPAACLADAVTRALPGAASGGVNLLAGDSLAAGVTRRSGRPLEVVGPKLTPESLGLMSPQVPEDIRRARAINRVSMLEYALAADGAAVERRLAFIDAMREPCARDASAAAGDEGAALRALMHTAPDAHALKALAASAGATALSIY